MPEYKCFVQNHGTDNPLQGCASRPGANFEPGGRSTARLVTTSQMEYRSTRVLAEGVVRNYKHGVNPTHASETLQSFVEDCHAAPEHTAEG